MTRSPILPAGAQSARPMRPDSGLARAVTGTRLVKVEPKFAADGIQLEALLMESGAGIEIVRGAGGFGASGLIANHLPTITFLVGDETIQVQDIQSTQNDDGGVKEGRTFLPGEVRDGARLPGVFDRIYFRWGTGISRRPQPLWIRIMEPQYGRIVSVVTEPPRKAVDWFVFQNLTITGADTVIYDDEDNPATWSEVPTIGEGFGPDTAQHNLGHSGAFQKRRMVAWFNCTSAYDIAIGTTDANGLNFLPQYIFSSIPRTFNGGTTSHVVDLGMRALLVDSASNGSPGRGIMLVPGFIRILAALQAPASLSLRTTLSFLPE